MEPPNEPSARVERTAGPPPGRRPIRTVALVVALWAAIGFFAGVQLYMHATLDGDGASLGASILKQTLSALAWVPATLVAIALTRRFPVSVGTWRRPLAVHAFAAVVLAYVTNVFIHILHGVAGPTAALPPELWASAFAGILRWGHVDVLVYALIAGLAHAFRRRREDHARRLRTARLEAELTGANLRALKLQLQPHFFFNTLHTIGGLWRTGRPQAAEEVLERFSTLLRRVLDPDVGQEVTLERELDFTREYLAIEGVRFGDRLRIEIDVDDEALDAYVPSFVLQPLVENAVRHGIGQRGRGGRLRIRARRAGGELRLEVADDGIGQPSSNGGVGVTAGAGEPPSSIAGRAPERADDTHGIGLDNTRRRLRELYGGDRLELTPSGQGGTRVALRIPFRTDSGAVGESRRPVEDRAR